VGKGEIKGEEPRRVLQVLQEEKLMPKEHIAAGAKVHAGIYRCNACANEHECKEEGEKLPQCSVCDSISWRTYRLKSSVSDKKNAKK
jgi:hypothetical protein